jgi:hypothetical protein
MAGEMAFDFPKLVGALTGEERLCFYECLAHDLTVANRFIWSNNSLSDAEKVDQMKWLNEILHRVTAKTVCLRRHTHEWTEQDFGSMVQGYIAKNQAIVPLVTESLWRCLKCTLPQ